MSFISVITDFFNSIFRSSSPEVKKRLELKKIEGEVKAFQPQIYKNEYLQPNFGELFRVLYENSKSIDDILSSTLCSGDLHRNGKFEYHLIMTGFSKENQEKFGQLSFEERKKQIIESDEAMTKIFEIQRRSLEALLKQMVTKEFAQIEDTIAKLHQLEDICRYNAMTVIHMFDPDYSGPSSQFNPTKPVSPEAIVAPLQDLYYLIANLSIDSACVRALIALQQLRTGSEPSDSEKEKLTSNVKKISTVLTKIITPEILKKLIQIGKRDASYVPQTASYTVNALKKFHEYVMGRFNSDEEKIKGEIKDYTISFELKKLFSDRELMELNGYNNVTNDLLRENTPYSLLWVTPLQTIKTFISIFYTESVKSVLNSIVVEGFFNNAQYKTDFSATVYACNETANNLAEFEKSFDRGGKNDRALIEGYIADSRKDANFLKKLASFIDAMNEEAHKLIQTEVSNFFSLYKEINELIVDSKKSKSVYVSNIKVLLSSSRNRDSSSILEQQQEYWKIFLEIMKNYAIVGELEDKA